MSSLDFLGPPSVKYLVKAKQRQCFHSLWRDRQHMRDDPWTHIVKVVLDSSTRTGRYIDSLLADNVHDVAQGKTAVKLSIHNSVSSHTTVFKTLNPDLTVDKLYCERNYFNEVHRISYCQFPVSGHWLANRNGSLE